MSSPHCNHAQPRLAPQDVPTPGRSAGSQKPPPSQDFGDTCATWLRSNPQPSPICQQFPRLTSSRRGQRSRVNMHGRVSEALTPRSNPSVKALYAKKHRLRRAQFCALSCRGDMVICRPEIKAAPNTESSRESIPKSEKVRNNSGSQHLLSAPPGPLRRGSHMQQTTSPRSPEDRCGNSLRRPVCRPHRVAAPRVQVFSIDARARRASGQGAEQAPPRTASGRPLAGQSAAVTSMAFLAHVCTAPTFPHHGESARAAKNLLETRRCR